MRLFKHGPFFSVGAEARETGGGGCTLYYIDINIIIFFYHCPPKYGHPSPPLIWRASGGEHLAGI